MKEDVGAKIAIVITVLLALSLFVVSDHSGLSVTDINIQKSDLDENTYEFSYILRLSRTFNSLDCRYILYDGDRNVSGNIFIGKVYDGSMDISDNITITYEVNEPANFSPNKVDLMFFTEKFDPKRKNPDGTYSQKPIYNKTYSL
jgi:hypothetical protein